MRTVAAEGAEAAALRVVVVQATADGQSVKKRHRLHVPLGAGLGLARATSRLAAAAARRVHVKRDLFRRRRLPSGGH